MSDPIKKYPGKDVDVFWDRRLCIHIGECGRAKGALFQSGRDPWCDPNVVDADNAVDVVLRCPTGALTYTQHDGSAQETAPPKNQVFVSNNGPLYITGDLEIDGAAEDMAGVAFRAGLCRCGQSSQKPFCDNAHEKANFVDRGAIGEQGPGNEDEGGKLVIKRAPNGPLLLSGNFELVTPNGRIAWKGKKAALCRCGASKNKPFCDGKHKDIDFEAE